VNVSKFTEPNDSKMLIHSGRKHHKLIVYLENAAVN